MPGGGDATLGGTGVVAGGGSVAKVDDGEGRDHGRGEGSGRLHLPVSARNGAPVPTFPGVGRVASSAPSLAAAASLFFLFLLVERPRCLVAIVVVVVVVVVVVGFGVATLPAVHALGALEGEPAVRRDHHCGW